MSTEKERPEELLETEAAGNTPPEENAAGENISRSAEAADKQEAAGDAHSDEEHSAGEQEASGEEPYNGEPTSEPPEEGGIAEAEGSGTPQGEAVDVTENAEPDEKGTAACPDNAAAVPDGAAADQEKSGRPALSPAAKKILGTAGFYLLRVLCVLLLTLAVAVGALYGLIRVMVDGPSETARELFVMSVRETSAIGFLADLFLTPEEIAQIEANQEVLEYPETDTSLVTIEAVEPGTEADAWGLVDDDGDGIVIDEVKGEGYSGYMMVVYDPSRVIMGCIPSSLGSRGYTVEGFVQHFDAVAGINGGGFADENGQGNGSTPDKAIVFDGQMYYGGSGTGSGFVGLDYDHKLHVGLKNDRAVREANIQYGCSFGPVLVSNGVGADPDKLESGINPRTAIGQRSDGAILMLVIDGRQVISLGATYADLTEIMLRYGAVNACNLDGGSSSLMYYNGAYVNNCASVIGIRDIPTSFIVLKEGANGGE